MFSLPQPKTENVPWRLLMRQIRRRRLGLMISYGAAFACTLGVAWDGDFFWYLFIALAATLSIVGKTACLFRDGAKSNITVQELLVTPVAARDFASAIFRLYGWWTAAAVSLIMLAAIAYVSLNPFASVPRAEDMEPLAYICSYMAAVLLMFCMCSLFTARWVITGTTVVLATLGALALTFFYALSIAFGSRRSTSQSAEDLEFVMMAIFYVSISVLVTLSLICIVRCYRRYADFLRSMIP